MAQYVRGLNRFTDDVKVEIVRVGASWQPYAEADGTVAILW
jgi:hypothetical protein